MSSISGSISKHLLLAYYGQPPISFPRQQDKTRDSEVSRRNNRENPPLLLVHIGRCDEGCDILGDDWKLGV